MYLSHYGLSKKPFEISPDPDFLWLGENHREGLAILKYGILENKGFLLITGEVGTGKTALIRAIEKEIQARAIVVTIPDPGMSLMDFFNFMASELHMDRSFKNKGEFLIHFKRLILKAFSSYRRVLLIIDESQRLNHELLEEIRLLSNIDLAGKVLINIFFVGQTEFRKILARDENRAVRQRITVSYHLPPLTPDEVVKYISHRLAIAGASREIFTPEALQTVHRFSNGFPRLINIICDHALMSGYARGLDRVDAKIIRECGEELKITIGTGLPAVENPPPAPPAAKKTASPPAGEHPPRTARSVLIFASFVLLLGIGWHFWGDSVSDQLERWGKGKELRMARSPMAGEDSHSPGRVPPLPVESGPRGPQPAEAAGDAPQAPTPPAAKSTSAAVPKAETKKQPSALEPAKSEPRAVSPPPAIAAQPPAQAAPPSPTPAPAVPPADEPFKLKDFTVYFTQNSAEVPVYASDVLATAAALLKTNPGTSGIIEGHTDSTGDPGYNRVIAEYRANSVKASLVQHGVQPSRLTTSSFASEKPVDTNSTPEGRSKNRRVVIRIVPAKPGG